jgi:hypothetical protein
MFCPVLMRYYDACNRGVSVRELLWGRIRLSERRKRQFPLWQAQNGWPKSFSTRYLLAVKGYNQGFFDHAEGGKVVKAAGGHG